MESIPSYSLFDKNECEVIPITFWQKKKIYVPPETIIKEGYLDHFCKKNCLFKKKYLVLYEFFLISYKDKNKENEKGHIDFHNNYKMKVNPVTFYKNQCFFSFTIKKFAFSKEYFCKSKEIFDSWIQILKFYTVRLDFLENYILEIPLGKGNFAEVYKVKNIKENHYYAGKVMHIDKVSDVQAINIIKEINVMRSLKTFINVLKLYEVFELENAIIIICELMECDLYSLIKNNKIFPEKKAHYLIIQILNGLFYMKNNKIIHRDIKLENILVDIPAPEKEILKIGDFGLSDYNKGQDMTKKCGTPGYLAPELIGNKQYNEKIDVFAAGIILFTL